MKWWRPISRDVCESAHGAERYCSEPGNGWPWPARDSWVPFIYVWYKVNDGHVIHCRWDYKARAEGQRKKY